jgi:lipase
VRLHVHRFGPRDGAPLLVVHGVRNTGARYRRLAEEGLHGVRVLAPDLRGHGASGWDPPWDPATHAADLIETMDAEGLGAVAVAGHSFGGLLGMRLAAAAPGRVSRLALLDPAVALPAALCAAEAEADRLDEGWASVEEARAARLALRPAHARDTVDEDLATHLALGADGRHRLRFSRPAAICAWSAMAAPPPSLAAYPGPVLLVPALRERYVTPALRAALAADLGHRLAVRGIEAGHMLLWDAREELAAVLRDFLSAAAAGSSTPAPGPAG